MAETITQTVTDYVHAMTYADTGLMREVFDPRASTIGHDEGSAEWLSLEDVIDRLHAPGSALSQSDSTFEILGIDRTGDTASVKLKTELHGVKSSDYLSLIERNGNWTITHRLYHLTD